METKSTVTIYSSLQRGSVDMAHVYVERLVCTKRFEAEEGREERGSKWLS